jgi:hypothetical protein
MRFPLARGLTAFAGVLAFAFVTLLGSPAHAYVWMLKHGFAKCGDCHTDPSGGETLTGMGRAQAEHLLSANLPPETSNGLRPASEFLFGALPEPDGVRLGAVYRHMFLYSAEQGNTPSEFTTFPMQLDAYGFANVGPIVLGGSLGVAHGIDGSAHARGAQLNRELGEGWLVLSRNHFLGVRVDEWTLLRFGRLNLPFGVRIPEHVAWVREATRTDRESDQQDGLALSYARGRLRMELMAIIGNFQMYPDRYRERGYSASAELLATDRFALGISSLITRANEDRFTQARESVRHAHGLYTRAGLSSRWALWAEGDVIKEGGRDTGYTGLLQVDFEPLRGLHLMLTGEALDQGKLQGAGPATPGAGEPRLGAWASVLGYAFSHFELRLDVLKRQESPFTLQAQLHVFL